MSQNDQLERFREALDLPPRPTPISITVWQAMSLLQKAVRRGRLELALQATAGHAAGQKPPARTIRLRQAGAAVVMRGAAGEAIAARPFPIQGAGDARRLGHAAAPFSPSSPITEGTLSS